MVAHPPGARWGRSWGGNPTQQPRLVLGDDEGCFAAALDAMRRHGGVLEHPEASPAWTGLRTPHATESRRVVVTAWQGEWTCCVEKDTTGTAPARPQGGTPWAARCLAPAGEERSGQSRRLETTPQPKRWRAIKMEACQRLSHRERNATPEPFRDLLIAMAGTVKMKSETG